MGPSPSRSSILSSRARISQGFEVALPFASIVPITSPTSTPAAMLTLVSPTLSLVNRTETVSVPVVGGVYAAIKE